MTWKWNNGILRSSVLEGVPGLVHGVSSCRWGNMRLPENLIKFARQCDVKKNFTIVRGRQVHGTNLRNVKKSTMAGNIRILPDTDGLVTCENGVILCILIADCAPVILAAPKNKVLACLHVGWRGFAGNILRNAFRLLNREFGVQPKEIIAGIGPHIGRCCYEVGWEVARKFSGVCRTRYRKKWRVDLGGTIRAQMLKHGVTRRNIDLCRICTYEEEKLYSFRRNGTDERLAALVGWQIERARG